MDEFEKLVDAFKGCDALIHMAAIPSPGRHPDHIVHNNNVVGSYNALQAAVDNGIMRICQASSVNAIGHSYSRDPHYDYLPIDEEHANYSEEPYSLSKWICEARADAFARRWDDISIASMRFHWVVPERSLPATRFTLDSENPKKHLFAYTRFDAAARACLLSVEGKFKGHEAFYIVAPDTTVDIPSLEVAAKYLPGHPDQGRPERPQGLLQFVESRAHAGLEARPLTISGAGLAGAHGIEAPQRFWQSLHLPPDRRSSAARVGTFAAINRNTPCAHFPASAGALLTLLVGSSLAYAQEPARLGGDRHQAVRNDGADRWPRRPVGSHLGSRITGSGSPSAPAARSPASTLRTAPSRSPSISTTSRPRRPGRPARHGARSRPAAGHRQRLRLCVLHLCRQIARRHSLGCRPVQPLPRPVREDRCG